MPKMLTSPDRLFDRTWRPGHPFRRRLSSSRRWGMTTLFVLLCSIIGGYWYITDSQRVRTMAESYLTLLLGGPVTVGDATLSIFEGLRLDDVRVHVDRSSRADARLFSASSFIIEYDPRALLSGRIEATRIIAVEPQVFLTEDMQTGEWNYQRLNRPGGGGGGGGMPRISVLPEIILRNAQVAYSRLEGNRRYDRGTITIEGQLTPIGNDRYTFRFQSLGKRQGVGPLVRGNVVLGTGELTAELRNFEFGEDIKAMLPAPVHRWWEEHQLAGTMDVEELTFSAGAGSEDPEFSVRIRVQGVKLTVHPEEWMGAEDIARLRTLRGGLDVMRLSGLNSHGFVDRVAELTEPSPLQLRDVYAVFTFTQGGIRIEDLTGKLEDIAFKIDGTIDGYNPSATANVTIASLETRHIEIPAAPRYVSSMPRAVREVYDRFRPRGTASFWLNLNRPVPDARPQVTGQIDIIDGSFVFDRFPYPLSAARGRIVLGVDAQTGHESLRLERIRGRGTPGGPNADGTVEINGEMGPFTPDMTVDVVVTGTEITAEPALIAAFPEQTREALTHFDAPGKGEYPRFSGDFECRIMRIPRPDPRWVIETDVKLRDAAGMLEMFPYPLTGVEGDLRIRDDHLEIVGAVMHRGDATLRVDGRISWERSKPSGTGRAAAGTTRPSTPLRPELKVTARNVPIDEDLLAALPEDRRDWLKRMGASGNFDLDGTLTASARPDARPGEPDFDFKITLLDGTLWPEGGLFAVSELAGELRLTPTELAINRLTGRREGARIQTSGNINWLPGGTPRMVLRAEAEDLQLEPALYQALPAAARRGWDQVQPEGTIDVVLNYSGQVGGSTMPATQEASAPTTAPASGVYEVVITPKKLSATPLAVPYRLDDLYGTITVLPDSVTLRDVTGKHGDATIRIVANGSTARDAVWDFQIAGEKVPINAALREAVPPALAEMLASMNLTGTIGFEFSKLRVSSAPDDVTPEETTPEQASATTRATDATDVEFAVRITTDDAALEVGVPVSNFRGTAEFEGSTKKGRLHVLNGTIAADSLKLANRDASDLRAFLHKPAEHDAMQINRVEVKVADGVMAGQMDYAFPQDGPSRYAVALVLRNADVKQLTGRMDQDIRGQLTASLNLEGTYNDPNSRRGRGDVVVAGQQLYNMPLLLGLMQVTELALPISGPFRDGSARYSIEGQRVTFEQIELRSKEMLMQGDGYLDFGKKQVRMTFITDARGWPKLPIIGDLMQSARNELLQIHVRGSLEEPKVSASSMNTFTTTIDEVFRGNDREAKSE